MNRFVSAAEKMQQDGWWWQSPELTNKAIKRQMLKEILRARFPLLKQLSRSSGHGVDRNPVEG